MQKHTPLKSLPASCIAFFYLIADNIINKPFKNRSNETAHGPLFDTTMVFMTEISKKLIQKNEKKISRRQRT